VTVGGPVGDDGFVVDFADVKASVKPVIDQLDHHYLNEIEGLENPTVENQLTWIWERISLPGLHQLRLQEGMGNAALYP